jgi:aminopeptidase-like protein
MANDNLSGVVASIVLFKYLLTLKTKFSYRLVIAPETIGTIVFLEQTNYKNIIGGMIMSCMAGPGKFSIKEGFKKNHWINKAAHSALNANFNDDYITYPFEPDGSDERQFSSPGFKIVTPSIHKSKYYEYLEYHTSADNLSFITVPALEQSISIHKQWIKNIESYCYPLRSQMYCEFQLGKRGLYPSTGGSINQMAHNKKGNQYKYESSINITSDHTDAFQWIMHLADGTKTNFEISEISNINLQIINDSLILLSDKNLIFLNKDPISN